MKFDIYQVGRAAPVRSGLEAFDEQDAIGKYALSCGGGSPGAQFYAVPDEDVGDGNGALIENATAPRNADIVAQLEMTGWKREAEDLAARARAAGYVVSITTEPQRPLAMGNHRDVVSIHRARGAQ